MKSTHLPPALALTLLLGSSVASAGTLDAGFRLAVMGEFAFGGEYDFNPGDDDAEASVGFGVLAEYPLFQYFSIGLNVGFMWWNTEPFEKASKDANLWVDLSPVLIGRYVFLGGRAEASLSIPIGMTISVPSGDHDDEQKTAVGWNAGVLAGFNYNIFSKVFLGLKIGWQGHGADNEGKDAEGGGQFADFDYSVHQFALWVGGGWVF